MSSENLEFLTLNHHAYCLEGNTNYIRKKFFEALEKNLSFKTKANPDFWFSEFEKFGIDDAGAIINFQLRRPVRENKKIIVVQANSLSVEAQNSLLKTFEEPSPDTHFFLIINSSEALLPTLKSRLQIQKIEDNENDDEMPHEFIKASTSERLELIKEITENKDRARAMNLLNQIEKSILKEIEITQIEPEQKELLQTINKFRAYLGDRSPSIKMILEHIALILPKM